MKIINFDAIIYQVLRYQCMINFQKNVCGLVHFIVTAIFLLTDDVVPLLSRDETSVLSSEIRYIVFCLVCKIHLLARVLGL